MSGVNKVILVGNLGQDPESRALPSGDTVTNLRLATSEKWTDKATGEKKERTEWHTVAIFGKLAEIAAQHLNKGSTIYVEGTLRTRKWQDKNGNDRYSTEVVVDMKGTLQFLSSKKNGDGEAPAQRAAPPAKAAPAKAAAPAQAPNLEEDEFDDDLPF